MTPVRPSFEDAGQRVAPGLFVNKAVKVNFPTKPAGHPIVSVLVRYVEVSGVNITFEFALNPAAAAENAMPQE